MRLALLLALVAALAWPTSADAQVWVAPRRPGKSVVRYQDHAWKHVDLLAGEEIAGKKAGGIRLFFYEEERVPAEHAAVFVEAAFRKLADDYDFVPPERFPFILYASYTEFLRTNLFPLQEGVLGVTSTRSLEVTLPFFGDAAYFDRVSTHELGHQFLIQKVRTLGEDSAGDPLNRLPLWFVEGIAEYYATGFDDESRMLVHDLVTNPDVMRGYGMLGFFDDIPGSSLWTYRVGVARITFLEEVYGKDTVQKLIDRVATGKTRFGAPKSFETNLEELVGEDRAAIAERFTAWLKGDAYAGWLGAKQTPADLKPLDALRGYVQTLAAAPAGDALLYRSIDPHTGRVRLWLVDPRAPLQAKDVAVDGVPGVESLHPVEQRSFDLGKERLVYVAEAQGRDRIAWQTWSRKATKKERSDPDQLPPIGMAAAQTGEAPRGEAWRVRFRLGRREFVDLRPHGLVAAFAPSLSPDGTRVAFVGLDEAGQRDLYVVALEGDAAPVRLTRDPFAERATSWGVGGIVYTSDATGHGKQNLFRVAPEGGEATRLTTEAVDHDAPVQLADGRVLFTAWVDGHAQLHAVEPEGVRPVSDVATALATPAPGPGEEVRALLYESGAWRPARVSPDGDAEPRPAPPPDAPRDLDRRDLAAAVPYRPGSPENWRLDDIFGLVGAGGGSLLGMLYMSGSDRLRDHMVTLNVYFYGELALTDGYMAYLDQSGRTTWGGGPFHYLRFRVDETLGEDLLFQSGERFYGGFGSWRYPFGPYVYAQVDEAVGEVRYFLFEETAAALDDIAVGDQSGTQAWEAAHGEPRFQSETTVRVGLDTVGYHATTGPIDGSSLLAAGTFGWQPFVGETYQTLRLDGETYLPIRLSSGTNLGFRGGGGTSFGGTYAQSFYLLSYDTLRSVGYGDEYLLGRHFWFARSELQVPLDAVVRVAFLSGLEAIAGLDAGAVTDDPAALWDERVLGVALGGNLTLGPLQLRMHWATPLDIGGAEPTPYGTWMPNISLAWLSW